MRDVELMIGFRLNWYWRATWLVASPGIIIALIIFLAVKSRPLSSGDYVYPVGYQVMGHLIGILPIAVILGWFLFKYCREGGFMVSPLA